MSVQAVMSRCERFRVQCEGHTHVVELDHRGVHFPSHEGGLWEDLDAEQAMAVLEGIEPSKPVGCREIAAMVRAHQYLSLTRRDGARALLSKLRGKVSARALKRRKRAGRSA